MIGVEGLVRRFGSTVAVKGITFNVNDGEIYGLLGPNGSGKSTTMKILAGIIPPSGGRVVVNGIDVSRDPPLRVKEVVGYVPETPLLYESLTPVEFFNFVGGSVRGGIRGRNLGGSELRPRQGLGIERYLGETIGGLSFGTKQKISLISAMLHDPQVLILDEAMNGLDPKSARILRELLLGFKEEGKSIVFSTHVLALAETICDRVGVIYNGEIIAEGGTVDELKEFAHEESLEDVFLKLTESQEEVAAIVGALREAF